MKTRKELKEEYKQLIHKELQRNFLQRKTTNLYYIILLEQRKFGHWRVFYHQHKQDAQYR